MIYNSTNRTSFHMHCAKKKVFSWGLFQYMWPNPQFPADLITYSEEIFNRKLHFLCSDDGNIGHKLKHCNVIDRNLRPNCLCYLGQCLITLMSEWLQLPLFFMLLVVILKKINCKVFMSSDSFVRNYHQISLLIWS